MVELSFPVVLRLEILFCQNHLVSFGLPRDPFDHLCSLYDTSMTAHVPLKPPNSSLWAPYDRVLSFIGPHTYTDKTILELFRLDYPCRTPDTRHTNTQNYILLILWEVPKTFRRGELFQKDKLGLKWPPVLYLDISHVVFVCFLCVDATADSSPRA